MPALAAVPAVQRARAAAGLAALALPAVAGAVLLGLGVLAAGITLLVLGLLLVVTSAVIGAPARLASSVGGRLAEPSRDERLLNLAEGLCVAAGLELPEVRVLDDDAANALLLATSRRRAVLVVTEGLLKLLERVELEGVLAHELAHLRRGDAAVAALATRGVARSAR